MFLECPSLQAIPNFNFPASIDVSKISSSDKDCTII